MNIECPVDYEFALTENRFLSEISTCRPAELFKNPKLKRRKNSKRMK